MARDVVLAIDEGTSNCKAVLVAQSGEIIASGSAPVPIEHPQSGWVQQDAMAIWSATQKAISICKAEAPDARIVALGISNQRESVLIWDRRTGAPLGPVLTWQCRRTAAECEALKAAGHAQDVIARTGLPIDPLFPPTKVAWLLAHHGSGTGDVCVGTVDSWLIWQLSGGRVHATDRSNAARTQLFNLADGAWDSSLCDLFGVDPAYLPEVRDSAHVFGETRNVDALPDGIPIASAIGDSHAALFGHGAFVPGDGKVTFGTGSSVMATIPEFVAPPDGLTTTIAWSLHGKSTFAFEGNILVSASVFPWTARMLGLGDVDALLKLAGTSASAEGVCLVPAHVGLGAPHWAPEARGMISGLSFVSEPAHIARAAAESMAQQVADIFDVIERSGMTIGRLSVDGGPSENRFLMQMVADLLAHPVTPCRDSETSAIGAAYLAGLATGFWQDLDQLTGLAARGGRLVPDMPAKDRKALRSLWKDAVARTTLRL
ncbi:Glycerol kinase [Candidatus Rhodobacter oscarellae]|uniref:Glycerol kinase n=1 Tax=Candidatus Rhodobacter oscarellae TaxID=1675527 RepID=A0A0J9E4J0_9RHOB|nr:Glycerol kinase [Candidatus Rhodobacter lobularis]